MPLDLTDVSGLLEKVTLSSFVLVLAPREAPDAKILIEIGAAIWCNRPIVLVVPPQRTAVPPALRKLALTTVVADLGTPAGRMALEEAVRSLEWMYTGKDPLAGGEGGDDDAPTADRTERDGVRPVD